MSILGGDSDRVPQVLLGVAAQAVTAQPDLALRRVPEAQGQARYGALSRAAGADRGDPATGLYLERDATQGQGVVLLVTEATARVAARTARSSRGTP